MGLGPSKPKVNVVLTPASFQRVPTDDDFSVKEGDLGQVTQALDNMLGFGYSDGLEFDVRTSPELGNLFGMSVHARQDTAKGQDFFHSLKMGDLSVDVLQSDIPSLHRELPVDLQGRLGFNSQGFTFLLSGDKVSKSPVPTRKQYMHQHGPPATPAVATATTAATSRSQAGSPPHTLPATPVNFITDHVFTGYVGGSTSFTADPVINTGVRYTSDHLSGGIHVDLDIGPTDTVPVARLWALRRARVHEGAVVGAELVWDVSKKQEDNLRNSRLILALSRETIQSESALLPRVVKHNRTRKPRPVSLAPPEFQFRFETDLMFRTFIASYYRRFVFRRTVLNPTEADNVVGIENPLEVGCEVVVDRDTRQPTMTLGGSWQPNKNWLLKSKASVKDLHVAVACKAWVYPSVSFGISKRFVFGEKNGKMGFFLKVEDYGGVAYQRPSKIYDNRHARTGETLRIPVPDTPAAPEEYVSSDAA